MSWSTIRKESDKGPNDNTRSLSRQRERELNTQLGVDSSRSSSVTRQESRGRDRECGPNMNAKDDEEQASKSGVKAFAGVASPTPALGSREFKKVNPMPADALL